MIPKAYEGNGNYIVISYCHADSEKVADDIFKLQSGGINVWYDEGLMAGRRWNEEVLRRIEKDACIAVVFYVSDTYCRKKAFWDEADMTMKTQKNLCVVMISDDKPVQDIYNQLYDNITYAEIELRRAEEPMSKPTLEALHALFDQTRIYIDYSDSKRFESLIKCFKDDWNYDNHPVVFPICNVKHNGHIEYLPSLLYATPFNYTFIAVSRTMHAVASSLNDLGKQKTTWVQFSLGEFLGRAQNDMLKDVGIVVCARESEITRIGNLLDKRRSVAQKAPLLLVIQMETNEIGNDNASDRSMMVIEAAKKQAREWKTLNSQVKDNEVELNDFFIVQTDERSDDPYIENIFEKKRGDAPYAPYRTLISSREYQDKFMDLIKTEKHERRVKWLFSQQPLSNDYVFDTERNSLKSDNDLIEEYDRIGFRLSS